MAQTTGKMQSTSRQVAGGVTTFTITVKSDPDPPGALVDFLCSEAFFDDAKDYLGKPVVITAGDPPGGGVPATVTGMKGSAP